MEITDFDYWNKIIIGFYLFEVHLHIEVFAETCYSVRGHVLRHFDTRPNPRAFINLVFRANDPFDRLIKYSSEVDILDSIPSPISPQKSVAQPLPVAHKPLPNLEIFPTEPPPNCFPN